ncbi:HSPB1-associated protein 1 homolog isoform X2 [Antedon mediterranea]
MATMTNLMEWCESTESAASAPSSSQNQTNKTSRDDNPLMKYNPEIYWCYADYKYMAEMFSENQDILKEVCWSTLGFEGRDGYDSTLWIGSEGANTPCHYDSYGCNLVLQVVGKKKWYLFSPDQTEFLYPTRIPYEESSVFSEVNIMNPDLVKHSLFQSATPYIVTLQPGDILVVPHHWWHYVESLETSVSVNCWMNLPVDDECRLQEAITRAVFSRFYEKNDQESGDWLNPTESIVSMDVNLEYINEIMNNIKKTKVKRILHEDSENTDVGYSQRCHAMDNPAVGRSLEDDQSAKCHRKRKLIHSDEGDVSEVKTKRYTASSNKHCMNFFREIGVIAEIVPRQMSKDIKQEVMDIAGHNNEQNVDVKTILQCVTHPKIISEISKLLLNKL